MKIKNKSSLVLTLDEFKQLKKIRANRPSGAETDTERLDYGYTRQEIDDEKKWLKKLESSIRDTIKKENFENCKIFIIGSINGIKYLMDGQHTGAIYTKLIEEGIFSEDELTFFCVVYEYDSYNDMISDLERINKAKAWRNQQASRLNAVSFYESTGDSFKGRDVYEEMAEEYYGILDDSVIKQCIFGQHNGEALYEKSVRSTYKELLNLYCHFQDLCKEKGLPDKDIKRLCGTNHCATDVRDLMFYIFRELKRAKNDYYDSKPNGRGDKEWRRDGERICKCLIEGILGVNAVATSNWSPSGAADLFKINHNTEFKKRFKEKCDNGSIRLYKRASDQGKKDDEILEMALACWLKNAR